MNFFKGQLYSGVAYDSIHSHFDRSKSFLRIPSCLPSKKVSMFLEAMLGFMCVSSLLLRINYWGLAGNDFTLVFIYDCLTPQTAAEECKNKKVWKRWWNPVNPGDLQASSLSLLPNTHTSHTLTHLVPERVIRDSFGTSSDIKCQSYHFFHFVIYMWLCLESVFLYTNIFSIPILIAKSIVQILIYCRESLIPRVLPHVFSSSLLNNQFIHGKILLRVMTVLALNA